MSLCNRPSKACTNHHFLNFLGLEVAHRPFDIDFHLISTEKTIEKQIAYSNYSDEITPVTKRTVELIPKSFKTYRCNESYEFVDVEYGAKCSCKVRNCF